MIQNFKITKPFKTCLFVNLFVVILLIGIVNAEAASIYYVQRGATGLNTGDDWSNAFTALPSTLVRGATYYIADGSYGSYTWDDAESGSTYIYVKKAIESDHGTDTGWISTYGDGQATFSSWRFSEGYYVIDGQTGGGPGSWDYGHGIVVNGTTGTRCQLDQYVDHITMRHIEISNDTNDDTNDLNYGHLIDAGKDVNHIYLSYMKIDRVFGCPLKLRARSDNWTIEYSKLGDNEGSGLHSEIMSTMGNDNITLRYNWLHAWRSTGGLIAINGTEGSYSDSNICEDWHIYGNVFDQNGSTASWVIAAIDNTSNQQFARRWRVYNNTFIDINSVANSVNLMNVDTYGESDNHFINNIVYGNDDTMIVNAQTETNNSYQGASDYWASGANNNLIVSDPFTNYTGGDYSLSRAIAGDNTLGSPFNVDMCGNIRGADGVWDRGAFEFSIGEGGCSGGGVADFIPPSAPTGLGVQSF